MQPNHKPNFKNRPQHLKLDDNFYFFTCRTIDSQWFLRPDRYKQILFDIIKEKTIKFGFPLISYVILVNHYHLIVKINDSKLIPKFMGEINGASSRAINQVDNATQRKIWWNYYDHALRDEADFFQHLNYIHQNPIKHKETKDFNYMFSSYNSWVKQKGQEYLDDCFRKYPIVDFKMTNDEF